MENFTSEIQSHVVRTLKHIIALSTTDVGKTRVPEKKAQLKKYLSDDVNFPHGYLNLAGTDIGNNEVAILASIAPENITEYDFPDTNVDDRDSPAVKALAAKPWITKIHLSDPASRKAIKITPPEEARNIIHP